MSTEISIDTNSTLIQTRNIIYIIRYYRNLNMSSVLASSALSIKRD